MHLIKLKTSTAVEAHMQTGSSAYTTAGGLECWDRRRAGRPQLRSPISWGITGSGALDSAEVARVPTTSELSIPSPFCAASLDLAVQHMLCPFQAQLNL